MVPIEGRDSERSSGPDLQTVQRALDVLEALAEAGGPVGTTELAAKMSLPKATAHRLLATLTARGYVAVTPKTSKYRLGLRSFELGMHVREHLDVARVALGHLEALNQSTRETVHLAVYDSGDAIYVEKLESLYPVSPKSRVGLRAPGFAVATGRVLLAFQSPEEIEAVLRRPLQPFTDATETDPIALHSMLAEIRRNGYATNFNSWRLGVCGIAAPIRDYTGTVVAAVGCCLPDTRFMSNQPRLRDATVAAGAEISRDLGWVQPPMPVLAGA